MDNAEREKKEQLVNHLINKRERERGLKETQLEDLLLIAGKLTTT